MRNQNRPKETIFDLHELRGMQVTTSREKAKRSQKFGLFCRNLICFVFRHFGFFSAVGVCTLFLSCTRSIYADERREVLLFTKTPLQGNYFLKLYEDKTNFFRKTGYALKILLSRCGFYQCHAASVCLFNLCGIKYKHLVRTLLSLFYFF